VREREKREKEYIFVYACVCVCVFAKESVCLCEKLCVFVSDCLGLS
jgi:hypothetical protein